MKKEPLNHEREQKGWLGATLRRVPASASDACLDAETLAAWVDGGLAANAAADVETHASRCPRCTAVLAAMERTAPAAPARHSWTSGWVFRWLVPLTAAATAVALWVAVPDRSIPPVQPRSVQDLQATRESADSAARLPVPVPVPVPESRTREQDASSSRVQNQKATPGSENPNQIPAPGAQNLELPFAPNAVAEPPPPPPAAAPAAPGLTAPRQAQDTAADSLARTAPTGMRAEAFSSAAIAVEAVAPGNSQFRWRVAGSTSIERSTDGGKTWTKTAPLPADSAKGLSITAMRVLNDQRAIAHMSDGSEFYTSNAGKSWTRLQENSAAPF